MLQNTNFKWSAVWALLAHRDPRLLPASDFTQKNTFWNSSFFVKNLLRSISAYSLKEEVMILNQYGCARCSGLKLWS